MGQMSSYACMVLSRYVHHFDFVSDYDIYRLKKTYIRCEEVKEIVWFGFLLLSHAIIIVSGKDITIEVRARAGMLKNHQSHANI